MIVKKIEQLFEIVDELKLNYPKKEFTLDGRLVGDIGEILAEQIYQIEIFNKVVKDYDAKTEYDESLVQIKTTMKDSIWYPRDKHPERLLAIEVSKQGKVKELYNGETSPFIKYLEKRKRNESYNYYTITKGILIKLNKEVDEKTRIKKRPENR